jgi:hypothetical protein
MVQLASIVLWVLLYIVIVVQKHAPTVIVMSVLLKVDARPAQLAICCLMVTAYWIAMITFVMSVPLPRRALHAYLDIL